MKGAAVRHEGRAGMKADSTDKAEPGSKSAQDGNRMQGEKSKSMSSEDCQGQIGQGRART